MSRESISHFKKTDMYFLNGKTELEDAGFTVQYKVWKSVEGVISGNKECRATSLYPGNEVEVLYGANSVPFSGEQLRKMASSTRGKQIFDFIVLDIDEEDHTRGVAR